jgi:hypothetical protein
MTSKMRLITLTFSVLCLLLSPALGQKAAIEADVIGVDGRPAKGAEVRIDRQGQKMTPVFGKTDGRGHLSARNLDAGSYKITAKVEGGIQLSQIVKTQANKASSAVFDMRKTAAIAEKPNKRYVWVQGETGSRLGGHWVEVNSNEKAPGTARNTEAMSSHALENLQRSVQRPSGGM